LSYGPARIGYHKAGKWITRRRRQIWPNRGGTRCAENRTPVCDQPCDQTIPESAGITTNHPNV